jgi:repressor LexA
MSKNILGSAIKELRLSRKMTQKQLSQLTGYSQNTISNHENMNRSLDELDIKRYADAFGVSPQYLFEMTGAKSKNHSQIKNTKVSQRTLKPLRGIVAAGMPLEMFEVPEMVQVPEDVDTAFPNAYFLIVRGDSMNKIIVDGSYALIDPCEELNNGEIGVVRVNGTEATLKRFYKMGDYIMLQPESTNPEHKNQIYTNKEEIDSISILGKLVWAMTPIGMKF